MSNPRFYCPETLAPGALVTLPKNAAIHAAKVLRMKTGDTATLFNGNGNNYTGELTFIKKEEVSVKITAITHPQNESPIKITLLQGISAGDRMDFTIQKAVEMGIHAIQPLTTQRSIVKLSGERSEKRREHWQNVAISACEQSGRAFIPIIEAPCSLPEWLSCKHVFGTSITLSPTASQSFASIGTPKGDVCLLIGSEGGLTDREMELAALHGFTGVRLGNRILRTETAALAALAAIQTLWGDYQ